MPSSRLLQPPAPASKAVTTTAAANFVNFMISP
jgi:hypothetical protein